MLTLSALAYFAYAVTCTGKHKASNAFFIWQLWQEEKEIYKRRWLYRKVWAFLGEHLPWGWVGGKESFLECPLPRSFFLKTLLTSGEK